MSRQIRSPRQRAAAAATRAQYEAEQMLYTPIDTTPEQMFDAASYVRRMLGDEAQLALEMLGLDQVEGVAA